MNSIFLLWNNRSRILLAATLGAACLVLAGCGGGGGGGGSTPQTTTLMGTVEAIGGSPDSGYTVYFDKGTSSQASGVTNTQGKYTITLSISSITGSDTLSVYDASGDLVYQNSVTVSKSQSSTTVNVPTSPVPPPPPI